MGDEDLNYGPNVFKESILAPEPSLQSPENHLTVSLLTLDTNTKKLLLIGKDIISLYLNLSFFLITEETSFTCLSALYFFCDLSVT